MTDFIPDDGQFETRRWFRDFRLQSRARVGGSAAAPRDERSIAAAWPHGSLGAHHAATRFYGAAHRLVVEL